MTRDDAEALTSHWLEAWNAHDVGAVLSSPHARQLLQGHGTYLEHDPYHRSPDAS